MLPALGHCHLKLLDLGAVNSPELPTTGLPARDVHCRGGRWRRSSSPRPRWRAALGTGQVGELLIEEQAGLLRRLLGEQIHLGHRRCLGGLAEAQVLGTAAAAMDANGAAALASGLAGPLVCNRFSLKTAGRHG
jgi:hypothetical protein